MKPVLIALFGPTAIGKTHLSLQLARYFNTEIVSVDSMQVYRHMNIGTAKPDSATLTSVKHHLIDICNPDEQFTVGIFIRKVKPLIQTLYQQKKLPLLAGGTGLYFCSLIGGMIDIPQIDPAIKEGLIKKNEEIGQPRMHQILKRVDPVYADKIHPHDRQRTIRALEVLSGTGNRFSFYQSRKNIVPDISFVKIGLTMNRKELYDRINHRVDIMFEEGLVNEVEQLLKMGYTEHDPGLMAIGYREIINYLHGRMSLDETVSTIKKNSRRYAKRQFTWFTKVDQVTWFEPDELDKIVPFIQKSRARLEDIS